MGMGVRIPLLPQNLLKMSRTFRRTSSYRLKKGEKYSKKLRDGSYTKAVYSCENNGTCPYCMGNRLYKNKKYPSLKEELILNNGK